MRKEKNMKRKIVNEITGRKKMTKRMRALAGVLGLTLCLGLTACGKNTDDEQKKESTKNDTEIGTIHVGTDGAYYPYCYLDEEDNELKGFEIDVLTEVGKRAGVDMDIEVVKWQGVFGMLDSGKIDTIACQMSITDERKEKYNFTDPYMYTPLRIAVQKGNESFIKTKEDLKGKRVACNTGGNSYATLEEVQKDVDFEIVPYDASGMEQDLSLGRVDALYQSAIATAGVRDKGEFNIDFAECEPLAYEVNAYPLRKDERSQKIIEAINKGLKSMREDGTLKEFSEKWFNLDVTEQ